MKTQYMLRVFKRHPLEANFQVMRVAENYRKRGKKLKKIAPLLRSTSGTPPTYDRAYPEMLSTASPDNPVGVTKPSFFLLFVQQDKVFGRVDKY